MLRAHKVNSIELVEECNDLHQWVWRKYVMLDVYGVMLKDMPVCRNGVWRSYGAEEDEAIVHRLSDQEMAWNKEFAEEEWLQQRKDMHPWKLPNASPLWFNPSAIVDDEVYMKWWTQADPNRERAYMEIPPPLRPPDLRHLPYVFPEVPPPPGLSPPATLIAKPGAKSEQEPPRKNERTSSPETTREPTVHQEPGPGSAAAVVGRSEPAKVSRRNAETASDAPPRRIRVLKSSGSASSPTNSSSSVGLDRRTPRRRGRSGSRVCGFACKDNTKKQLRQLREEKHRHRLFARRLEQPRV